MALQITPIGGRLAARVDGVSLRDVVSGDQPGTIKEIEGALYEHLVLLFPDQCLTDDELAGFMSRFGELYIHPIARQLGATRARVEHIIDDADHPPFQDGWHTDVTFDPDPPRIGCLQAIDMPDRGGETLWANMYAAYERLSEPQRELAEQLVGVHGAGHLLAFVTKVGPEAAEAVREQFAHTEHPVIGTHRVTGRKYLYVNPTFTKSIAGMTKAEGDAVLEPLFRVVASPNIQFRHHWTPGEVIIWDERATQHFVTSDHFPRRREIARVVVGAVRESG